jgi:hypothetical protein
MLKMNKLLGFVIFLMGSGQVYFWSYINVCIPSIYQTEYQKCFSHLESLLKVK